MTNEADSLESLIHSPPVHLKRPLEPPKSHKSQIVILVPDEKKASVHLHVLNYQKQQKVGWVRPRAGADTNLKNYIIYEREYIVLDLTIYFALQTVHPGYTL